MSETSFFSQISSFFGGNSNQTSRTSARRTTAFGSGFSSSSRRGPPQALDANAWALPYSSRNNIPASPAYTSNGITSPTDGQYPPASDIARASSPYGHEHASAISTSSVAEFSNMYPTASTSTLVPGTAGRAVSVSAGGSVPATAYPPLPHTWNRIRKWSRKHYPEIGDTLNWPCTNEALDELEMTIGYALPLCVRESYLNYDGQELESNQSCQDGLFFGAALLSLEQVAEEWKFWRAVDEDPDTAANPQVRNLMASCPHKWIRAEYSCRGWIPLITDHAGNYIGVDLSPHPAGGGAPGQVIIFGRDFDTKVVCWKGEGAGGWGRFLQAFADELEAGQFWTLEEPSSGSDDEEDAIGYNSYFSGGGAGASQGGGDRGGEGGAAFRLTAEYKGWPVLEAWADRSVRLWESVGLAPGKPLGYPHAQQQPKPQSVVDRQSQGLSMLGGEPSLPPALHAVDENGEAIDAEASASNRTCVAVGKELDGEVSVDGPSHPLADSSLAGETSAEVLIAVADANIPAESTSLTIDSQGSGTDGHDSADANLTPTSSTRRVSGMLSPPLPETKASLRKQKQREEGWGSPLVNPSSPIMGQHHQQRVRRAVRPPPAPAAMLDLPTIEDVKAIQAASLADDGKSHSVQFDSQSQGRSSFSNLGFRDLAGKIGVSHGIGGVGNGIASPNGVARREESVELETRTSVENRSAANKNNDNSSSSSSYIVGQRGRARGLGLENEDLGGATKALGGMMVSPRTRGQELPNLMDANSTPVSPVVGSKGKLGEAEVEAALA
ncbi:related to SMI1 - beta-1,3-glucan synthesis protein [Melanopsichium pennsylvanicum]|uniref:Related to SMI1 - beta-1,3-glucan synthesis protein n=2 Tax=Melanopsichium pennsylvanicum TaxID=63383 RepID=A0AAJ5C585_9BASI|nr:related to SMI1-beta-1,3-glucan synthesis protein [Melanopsichium pennsylvanicum 4]SNX84465.1 related to SMI1 - beta-1,3-glucan synthesis protein [Melanopsichium pennsylvanicum]